ncbi:exodeoxyribonuclease VII small subunit [Achromobacter sp. GG226]|uniref:exodeoxyribonuclease VII small subunit n=1 Tax=Verticiella alkaliphila TaxID=2779529 RepID=UPI001C0DA6BA|nr:exodeoxyribonuclease VII small subunit [Verticiella sp. GG226]MBU4609036.1 exodeoxyribonuclease VII small subunit [Verticiella sp. GG226]
MSDHLSSRPAGAPDAEPPVPDDFEAALAGLERIVGDLERGDLPLEASLLAYRQGVALVRACQRHLAQAEQQVSVLDADLLRPLQNEDVRGDA